MAVPLEFLRKRSLLVGALIRLLRLHQVATPLCGPIPEALQATVRKFRFANIKDWGGGDYQDLMTGVDHVIAMGVADPERLGVMGWSYGGFMTSWVITQTKRFKAASVSSRLPT